MNFKTVHYPIFLPDAGFRKMIPNRRGSHPCAKTAQGWGTLTWNGVDKTQKGKVVRPPTALRGTARMGQPAESSSSYLQSTLLSCEAAICHLPSRFNQVSVQTWHCFASGCVLSLPMACSLP